MSHVNVDGTTIYGARLTRRGFLAAGGALAVYATLARRDAFANAPALSHSLDPPARRHGSRYGPTIRCSSARASATSARARSTSRIRRSSQRSSACRWTPSPV